MRRRTGLAVRLSLALAFAAGLSAAQDRPVEPGAPAPSAAVQRFFDQANALTGPDAAAGGLALVEQALALAQQTNDGPGLARSHRARALMLGRLDRGVDALAEWHEAESAWRQIGDGPGQIEALGGQAALTAPDDKAKADDALARAIALAQAEHTRPRAALTALSLFAQNALAARQQELGSHASDAAVAFSDQIAAGSYDQASVLHNLSLAWKNAGDLDRARAYADRAVKIADAIGLKTLDMGQILDNRGWVAFNEGDLEVARSSEERALAINEALAPDSLIVAGTLGNLSDVLNELGDSTQARAIGERGIAIVERLAPNSARLMGQLGDLANVVAYQGDLSTARAYRERAMAFYQATEPESLAVAIQLNNLGMTARNMGDLAAALDYQRHALAIREKLSTNLLTVASSLKNLGLVESDLGELDAALDHEQRALAIREKFAPNSLLVAEVLEDLGDVADARKDTAAARDYETRALVIAEKIAPHSADVSDILHNIGRLAYKAGDRAGAKTAYERSLAISQQTSPDSIWLAQDLQELARIASDDGDHATAAANASRAWGLVKAQSVLIAGDEARQAFDVEFASICQQLVGYRIAAGQVDLAFSTLEEGRAQALLQMLGERGIARRLAPADVWHRYELAQAAADQAGSALADAGGEEADAQAALDVEIAQQSAAAVIQAKRDALAARQKDAQTARLAYTRARVEAELRLGDVKQSIQPAIPLPISTADARQVLDAGTVFAAFSVSDESTTLFLVTRDGPIRAFQVNLSQGQLDSRVAVVRRSVSRETGNRSVDTGSRQVREQAARDLYQALFPAEARTALAGATRILIAPDNVLWDLPFAALIMNDSGAPRYLGLEKPLVYAQSLATFAQTERAKAPARAAKLDVLVVGNPLFDNALRPSPNARPTAGTSSTIKRGEGELAELSRNGDIPKPLPYAEAEATAVARIYGVHASTGVEPTEAWFRAHAPQADVIHLATHGFFNSFRAVSSGVRLAVPEQSPPSQTDNDGALQAWEVFSLSLRADLIVLSACETGLGAKVPGEGLIGLTRAFQVAGAASVIATQWQVSDLGTEAGMVALHENLRRGVAKDEALRQAMRKVAADPTTADPYYWAPFVLVGDFHPLRAFAPR